MSDIHIRKEGRIGRITLQRPKALNAVTYEMILAIETALDAWEGDDTVAMALIDAEGDKAFCAGGDIQQMYDTAREGDFSFGRRFWADEYRMNAKLANWPKPFAALMQGFTMGGGVGISCHGSHRVVCETSQIAMPECSIGLIPDVGGSLLLARAPGRLGEYLGMTGARMGPGDAIHAGFADYFIPRETWPELTRRLVETGDWTQIDALASPPPPSPLATDQPGIDAAFGGETARDILRTLDNGNPALKLIRRNSPLSVASTVELIHRARAANRIERALTFEYRFTYRSALDGDFIEGIRAAIIDKDHTANWQHQRLEDVPDPLVAKMLMPLGEYDLNL